MQDNFEHEWQNLVKPNTSHNSRGWSWGSPKQMGHYAGPWDQIRDIRGCGQYQPEATLPSLKEQGDQGEVPLPSKKNHIHLQEG